MEEFLDSDIFQKMAMEYNRKYGGVSVLQTADINEEKFKDVLQDIHKLFAMLGSVAGSHTSFRLFSQKKQELFSYLEDLKKDMSITMDFSSKLDREVNNKKCMDCLSNVIKHLFSLHNERNFDKIEKILTLLLDGVNAFYAVF